MLEINIRKQVKIMIENDNEVFHCISEYQGCVDIAAILNNLATDIQQNGVSEKNLRDINRDIVGNVKILDDEHPLDKDHFVGNLYNLASTFMEFGMNVEMLNSYSNMDVIVS